MKDAKNHQSNYSTVWVGTFVLCWWSYTQRSLMSIVLQCCPS